MICVASDTRSEAGFFESMLRCSSMRFPSLPSLILLSSLGCTVVNHPPHDGTEPAPPERESRRFEAVAFSGSEVAYLERVQGLCALSRARAGLPPRVKFLGFCPTSVEFIGDTILLRDSQRSMWLDASGADLQRDNVVAARAMDEFVSYSGDRYKWVRPAGTVEILAPRLRDLRIMTATGELIGIRSAGEAEEIVKVSLSGKVSPLFAEPLRRIDSFDVSPDGKELILSGDRGGNFDIALASTEGGAPHWIAPDPLEETGVSWAPRGNKVTYRISTVDGTLVRTVHVPTGIPLTVDLPLAEVRDLAWEPGAERFAVIISSAQSGESIETMRYGGEQRVKVVGFGGEADANADRLSPPFGEAVLFSPRSIRYGEKRPLVVWVTEESPVAWNAVRSALHRELNAGIIVLSTPARELGASFWTAVFEKPWVDPNAVYLVLESGDTRDALEIAQSRRMVAIAQTDLPGDPRVRRVRLPNESVVVEAPYGGPGIVESVAYDVISRDLEGTNGSNGRR